MEVNCTMDKLLTAGLATVMPVLHMLASKETDSPA